MDERRKRRSLSLNFSEKRKEPELPGVPTGKRTPPIQKLQIVGLQWWRSSDLLGCSWSTPAEETMLEAEAVSNLPGLSALAGQESVGICVPDLPLLH